jgi:hypothetical protein
MLITSTCPLRRDRLRRKSRRADALSGMRRLRFPWLEVEYWWVTCARASASSEGALARCACADPPAFAHVHIRQARRRKKRKTLRRMARRRRCDAPRHSWLKGCAAVAAGAALLGSCSADCTTVEGHECCTFAVDASHGCPAIGSVLEGDDKKACGHHCLEDESCFWVYSAGGDYAGDCQLLGACGTAAANRPASPSGSAAGKMHSAGCFSRTEAEPVRPLLRSKNRLSIACSTYACGPFQLPACRGVCPPRTRDTHTRG